MAVYKDKSKTLDGRCWYFKVYKKDFNGINKAFKSKRYLTKKEAQEQEALFLLKRDNPLIKPFNLIARSYFDDLQTYRNDSTIESYKNKYINHIEPYFKYFNIQEIDVLKINDWKQDMLNKGYKINYLNNIYVILKSIFDFAMRNYQLTFNPVSISGRFKEKREKVIKDEEKIRYITHDEFLQFISVISDIMWKTLFILLYYTGMRKGEVLALTWEDIDFNKEIISVNKNLYSKIKGKVKITKTKNKQNRKVKMSKTLTNQLIKYKDEMKKYKDFKESWFVFGNTRFLPPTTIDRYKDHFFDLVNENKTSKEKITRITVHEFRHSHVSLLINEYVNKCEQLNMKIDTYKFFLMLSERLGHTIKVMQETYMHLFPTVQDEIVDILDNL